MVGEAPEAGGFEAGVPSLADRWPAALVLIVGVT
jgi:hypothetical protein